VGRLAVTDPTQVWPGMSSVSPAIPNLLAFAGQAPNLAPTCDQNWNQIWVQNGPDPGQSPALQIDAILGRAPWWSPNGALIVCAYIILGAKPRSTPQGPMAPQGIAIVEVPPGIAGA
jgi:hypothetical protein